MLGQFYKPLLQGSHNSKIVYVNKKNYNISFYVHVVHLTLFVLRKSNLTVIFYLLKVKCMITILRNSFSACVCFEVISIGGYSHVG